MATNYPEVMTVDEVCQYLRIPRSSLYKLAQEGKIPCQKVGRHWRFRREAIDRWLEQIPGLINDVVDTQIKPLAEES
jgi:excisionase family DNA binding protein